MVDRGVRVYDDSAATTTAAAAAQLDLVLRRDILRCGEPSASAADLISCADLATALGAGRIATTLRQTGWLVRGSGSSQPRAASPAAFAPDIAVDELRGLMRVDRNRPGGSPDDAVPDGRDATETASGDQAIDTLPGRLLTAMEAGDAVTVAALLDQARTAVLDRRPPENPDDLLTPAGVTSAVVARHLRRFLRDTYLLWSAPSGSAALLIATARLAHSPLGPHLSGVGRLLRDVRDLFGLVALASQGLDGICPQQWSVLLASRLDRDRRWEVIDEMADRGMARGLRGMLELERRDEAASHDRLCHIRDAALDIGDLALAVGAQAAVIDGRPDAVIERVVIAELHGTGGAMDAAAQALETAHDLDPEDRGVLARMAALRAGQFASYHAHKGYGSNPHRAALRASGGRSA